MCSAADERRDEQAIRNYSSAWKKTIKGQREKIIAQYLPAGAREKDASLGNLELEINFVAPCSTAVVTASYAWKLSYSPSPDTRASKNVSVRMTIPCRKVFGKWVCQPRYVFGP